MKKIEGILTLACALLLTEIAQAQKFTRDNYYDFIAPTPRIVSQTEASKRGNLYGDPGNDLNPADGVDDRRYERLLELTARFSPVLRRNNFSVPRDFESLLRLRYDRDRKRLTCDSRPTLHVDTWDLTGPVSQRVGSDSIDLGLLPAASDAAVDEAPQSQNDASIHDERLKQLLLEFHPDSSLVRRLRPERDLVKALYFDFPGEDEKTWKQVYRELDRKERAERSRNDSRLYAHPFIYEDPAAQDAARYELVIQYWTFYPFNDGPNNHEGDWEHINVRLTTLDRAASEGRKASLLTADDLARILDHENDAILDSLIIGKVDYYFHNYVMTLNYQAVDFLQEKEGLDAALERVSGEKQGTKLIYQEIYRRLHLVKDALNTHPIGYIGGDYVGPVQLLARPGGRNENSDGIYPFPGIWQSVGPLNTAERIHGEWGKYPFLLPPGKKAEGPVKAQPWYEARRNDDYLSYGKEDIILVPDWERIKTLVLTDPNARRKWSWLILPILWGFPAVESPMGGFVRHADTGNSAPVGPAYKSTWNRVGAVAGFEPYNPHVLPFRTVYKGPSNNFRRPLGFLNIPFVSLISLPVGNLAWLYTGGLLESIVESKDHNFVPHDVPRRFFSFSPGTFYTFGDKGFARLLPRAENAVISSFLATSAGSGIDPKSLKTSASPSVALSWMLHLSDRVSSGTTVSFAHNRLRYYIRDTAQQPIGRVEGSLLAYELTGSLRITPHRLFRDALRPYLCLGYGWSAYTVGNTALNGEPFRSSTTIWPSFTPNTYHLGMGLDLSSRKQDTSKRTGGDQIGARLEFTRLWNRIGDRLPADGGGRTIAQNRIGMSMLFSYR